MRAVHAAPRIAGIGARELVVDPEAQEIHARAPYEAQPLERCHLFVHERAEHRLVDGIGAHLRELDPVTRAPELFVDIVAPRVRPEGSAEAYCGYLMNDAIPDFSPVKRPAVQLLDPV